MKKILSLILIFSALSLCIPAQSFAYVTTNTWTIRTSAVDNSWRDVTWSPQLGLFAAVAQSGTGDRVMTSPDGITWTARVSAVDTSWQSITWSPQLGLFATVASSC